MKKVAKNDKNDAKHLAHLEAKKWLMKIKSKPLTQKKKIMLNAWLAESPLNKSLLRL